VKNVIKIALSVLTRRGAASLAGALVVLFALAAGAQAATVQNFDEPGTPFILTHYSGFDGPEIIGSDANPSGQFVRLTRSLFAINTIAFDQDEAGYFQRVIADFDFRITCFFTRMGFDCGDGFSFVLLDTQTFGTSGAAPSLDELGRSPLPTNSFAVGFNTFDNGSDDGNSNNSLNLVFNNGILPNSESPTGYAFPIPLETFDLATGINGWTGVFYHARIDLVLGGSNPNVTVTLTNDFTGETFTPISNYDLSGVEVGGVPLLPYEGRIAFGARTGVAVEYVDIDNVNVQFFQNIGPIAVAIDIKPDSDANNVSLMSRGPVDVALLTTEEFDASEADPVTLSFAGAPGPVRCLMQDVDEDFDMDLLCSFAVEDMSELAEDSEEATLQGQTTEGTPIMGTDSIRVISPPAIGRARGRRFR
jgi:hypothetical protein